MVKFLIYLFPIINGYRKNMNDLVTNVKSLELETLKNLRSSKASNTLRAYKSDYKDFASFCLKNGFKPMPSEPKIISLYLTYLSKSCKFSTLKRRLASISVIHRLSGHYIDTKHPMITENLMGIKRVKGSHQKAKKPILIDELKLIVNAIDKDKNEKNRFKNRALILVGFAGGFRRSELVAILYEDIERKPLRSASEKWVISYNKWLRSLIIGPTWTSV